MKVLDHGYIRLVESWGHGDAGKPYADQGFDIVGADAECGIIEAARQSTQGAFRGWEKDARLLKYLYDNKHSTPFEFAGCVIEVQAPLFVFREWHRHRTQSYNEMSARYEPLPELYYIPSVERLMIGSQPTECTKCKGTGVQSNESPGFGQPIRFECIFCDGAGLRHNNKQAGTTADARPLTEEAALAFQRIERDKSVEWEAHYKWALSAGIPKEIARNSMPVNHYSRMRASANLRNWLGFLTLRQDPKAQYEIRVYANALAEIMTPVFPHTMELFNGKG